MGTAVADRTTARTTAAPSKASDALDFVLPPELEAHEPPEASGGRRDSVRLMVSNGNDTPIHARFTDLPRFLDAGDLVVVNTSGTRPAAVDGRRADGTPVVVHISTELPAGLWVVEPRRPVPGAAPAQWTAGLAPGETLILPDGATVTVLAPYPGSARLWLATLALPAPLDAYLAAHGRPIRYAYVRRDWPVAAYQTVYATEPGSAEMPSAGRPFTAEVITALVSAGIAVTPLLLHTGVSSLEAHEPPFPERYVVPASTAERVNATRRAGGRIVAIGTTVVRALETVTDAHGTTHPGDGWTDVIITPERGVRAVDGLLTGWHEPQASHLRMLEAVAGRPALELAYGAALAAGYRWHEFGDSHLILRAR